jgi:hypothetical protein
MLVEGLIAGAVLGQEGQEVAKRCKSFLPLLALLALFGFSKKPSKLRAARKMN